MLQFGIFIFYFAWDVGESSPQNRKNIKNNIAMKIIDLNESNSVLNQFVSEIRNVEVQNDRLRFRRNIERIGEIMAYEMSKAFRYSPKNIQTPLGVASVSTHDNNIVLSTILRAGLPFHQGFLNYFDGAENAFVSAYRKYTDEKNFDIHIEYIASPRIDGKTLVIVDPMLATGGSMELSYRAMLTKGTPAEIHIASVIASRQAIEHVKRVFPDANTTVWCAAIDPEINAHSYIVPGLGDAGDLAFGEKE
jgi:uracil phosphoribosyltransferase